jgi:transcription-repair coupling factor (superfamily II helicase)
MQLPDYATLPRAGRATGLAGSGRALYLLRLGRPFVAVCRGEEEAARLAGDLLFFAAALGRPAPVLLPSPDDRIRGPRLAAIERIASGAAPAVVAGPGAAAAPVWAVDRLRAASVEVRLGGELDTGFLAELLPEMGYRRVQVAADAGEFAVRSGLVDLFPAAAEQPVRVEVGSGRVTGLRAFDVDTQRTFRDVPAIVLVPAREPAEGPSLFEALPGHLLVTEGDLGPEGARLPLPGLVLEEEARGGAAGGLDGLGLTARERKRSGETLAAVGARLAALSGGRAVLVAAETTGEAERLRELLGAAGRAVSPIEPAGLGAHPGPLALVRGRLSAGFADAASGFLAVTAAEIFGPRPAVRPPRASHVATLIATLDELAPGDHVVHLEHGVGRFVGIEKAPGGDADADLLRLEYAGGTSLLLPVERLDLLRRYQVAGGAAPRLDAIGGTAWRKAKARAAAKIREMAAELLRQHAERAAAPGHAFPPDGEAHREFAAAFPFEETPDQRASIEEIRRDMEAPRPMDRLLCGDVGYGKTEVAMRAAFKAAHAGRQVAVIAPTTLLAEQHAAVFGARFAPFEIRVEALTRFVPAAEEPAILARLAAGETRIVIGTHRLLGRDVAFADLGLLIVDEEQRFGVAHKERIRRLREGVDVLTLTATPIPRTLHLALSGLRGISTLETPPEERLAVKTVVSRFDAGLVREALERELARGGQAYFVHNRIESIGRVGVLLQGLLPGRRIGVAHARMPERALEEVMHAFFSGELDVLLATAIVGAGLDVPRANTILVDRADRFGLADLYQLKGRVGRADARAFAYFLVPHEDRLTEEARERLAALTELSFLGAGFRLALRDLEIRGAGDLLGAEQSGHIAAVGYDLYTEMLQAEVARLSGAAPPARMEPVIELRGAAHLPAAWIDDAGLRLSVLRKLAGAHDRGAVADLRRELQDRFGPPPLEAARLLDVADLRARCRAAGVLRLTEVDARRYRALFVEGSRPSAAAVAALAQAGGGRLGFLPEGGFEVDLAKRSWEEAVSALGRLLEIAAA